MADTAPNADPASKQQAAPGAEHMLPGNARRLNEKTTTTKDVLAAINAGQTRPTCSISHVAGSERALVHAAARTTPFPRAIFPGALERGLEPIARRVDTGA